MNTKETKKNLEKFLKKSDFPGLFCEIMKAMNSDDSEFILRVTRRAEKFHMDIMKYIAFSKTAKKLAECTSAEYLTALTLRAYDKAKPLKI